MLCPFIAFALLGFHSLFHQTLAIRSIESLKHPNDSVPHQTQLSTLNFITALVTQSDLQIIKTQTIVFTTIITHTESITAHPTTSNSVPHSAPLTLTNQSPTITRTSSTLLPTTISSAHLSVPSPSSTLVASTTNSILPPTPIISSELVINPSVTSLNAADPARERSRSGNSSSASSLAIPAIVIAMIVALGFIIVLLSYIYPHIRQSSKKRIRSRGALYDDYSVTAQKFSPPDPSTIDYGLLTLSNPSKNDKGKSRMVENLNEPMMRYHPNQVYEFDNNRKMWLAQKN
ncbi:hypothetical protein CROQUDRAFT_654584 [Cronartium quercuum f. sp. fusiforme G11]|uniref:Uncharacterized protein n=1 Tax=Cronartium quercuum f. sp. fusiforme G11 TaxID=708437 RepID=A0A9P6NMH8_9BASI|nr:hypothetical protein CROQUDRAFT_654584 [Cronartium quercuum f. sp. fusiforme G11]